MRFNSRAGSFIPKVICIIAVLSLGAFFVLNKKGNAPRYEVPVTPSTIIDAQPLKQTEETNQPVSANDSAAVNELPADIDSLPFSVSRPIPEIGSAEEGIHFYRFNVRLERGAIVDMDLKVPKGANLGVGIFNEDGELAYSNDFEDGGDESLRFVITDDKPITALVETIVASQTYQSGQYTLAVTSVVDEKGYLIDSLPFIVSGSISSQEKMHLYQTSFPLDEGTIVGANLKSLDGADLALYLSDDEGTTNYSKSKENGEEEAAMTLINGGRSTIIIDAENKGDKDRHYVLSVETKGIERFIESLPYTTTGYMSHEDAAGRKLHWYHITPHVPAGSVISANLSITGKANMDLTIFVDRDTISYGASHGIGENESAELAIEKDSKVYVIVDNVEGEGDYSLTITSTSAEPANP